MLGSTNGVNKKLPLAPNIIKTEIEMDWSNRLKPLELYDELARKIRGNFGFCSPELLLDR